jgi:hypothetical protein
MTPQAGLAWHHAQGGLPPCDAGVRWDLGDASARRSDPYQFWGALTGFESYLPPQRAGLRLAALELAAGCSGAAFVAAVDAANAQRAGAGQGPLLAWAPHHRARLAARSLAGARAEHAVAWIDEHGFAASSLAPLVGRYRLALISVTETAPAAAGPVGPVAPAPTAAALAPAAPAVAPAAVPIVPIAPPPALPAGRPLRAVIDFGCPFAHPDLARSGGGTRIAHLWDMGREPPSTPAVDPAAATALAPWRACTDFGYGREADASSLDALIATARAAHGTGPAAGPAAERACYETAAMPELLAERWSHGAAVLGELVRGADGRVAPSDGCDLAFVQLPQAAVQDLSGGWLSACLVDALHYVAARAGGRPVVANVSYGAYAGSHDGRGLLDAAIAALGEEHPLLVVVAAGNTREQGLQARVALAPGEMQRLQWWLPMDDPTQSFLELWYARRNTADAAAAARLQVRLVPPVLSAAAALAVPAVNGAGAVWLADAAAPRRPLAALLQVPGSAAGGGDGMALVAVAPTHPHAPLPHWGTARAPSGYWTLELTNTGTVPLEVQAWIERDDPDLAAPARAVQSRLFAPAGSTAVIDGRHTLTSLACGDAVLTAGSRVAHWRVSEQPAPDSSIGPARPAPGAAVRRGPDLLAPGVQWTGRRLAGRPVMRNLSDAAPVWQAGTSLAAPQVAQAAAAAIEAHGVAPRGEALLQHWFGPGPPPASATAEQIGFGLIDDAGQIVPAPSPAPTSA